jgi:CheY-like chemotaxis protein
MNHPLVLYVEDDAENWNATQLRLEGRYRLIRAATDAEACEAVRRHRNELFAILMDIELKGSKLNGVELTKLFRGKADVASLPPYARDDLRINCPIVFVTAYGARYPETDLLAMGGNKLVEKPVDFVKLTLALAMFNANAAVELAKKR